MINLLAKCLCTALFFAASSYTLANCPNVKDIVLKENMWAAPGNWSEIPKAPLPPSYPRLITSPPKSLSFVSIKNANVSCAYSCFASGETLILVHPNKATKTDDSKWVAGIGRTKDTFLCFPSITESCVFSMA